MPAKPGPNGAAPPEPPGRAVAGGYADESAAAGVGDKERSFRRIIALVAGLVPCEASPPAPLHYVERGGPAIGHFVGCATRTAHVAGAHSAPYELRRCG